MGCGKAALKQRVTELDEKPGATLKLFEGTQFAEVLSRGDIAVVSSAYFQQCWSKGECIADRANIPQEYFFKAGQLMDLWKKYGNYFLVVVSYRWLAKDHPDPDKFHLKRLVRILGEWKSLAAGGIYGVGYTGEIGVIFDYCSLWQGERSPDQQTSFERGLKQINVPYCHQNVGAIKIVATPDGETRKYGDSGWTFFESCVIDGKEASDKGRSGELNVATFDDSFDADGEDTTGYGFIRKYSISKRMPIRTPVDFEQQLLELGHRAVQKAVPLFTNGQDQPFILQRYSSCFQELSAAEKLDYTKMHWGDAELAQLARAIPSYNFLEELSVGGNQITDVAPLVKALSANSSLRVLDVSGNPISDWSPLDELRGKASLRVCT